MVMQLQGTRCTLDKLYFKKVYKRVESTDLILHNMKGSVSFVDCTWRKQIYLYMRRMRKEMNKEMFLWKHGTSILA